jgi:hypothetical protein
MLSKGGDWRFEMFRTFMDRYLADEVEPEAIDDFVTEWHQGPSPLRLSEYLGMTDEEYAYWLLHPDALPHIREERRVKA